MPDLKSLLDTDRATLIIVVAIQILSIIGGAIAGIVALRRQAKSSAQRNEEIRVASEIRLREIQTEERKRSQEHEQRIEEAREKSDNERTAVMERMATARDDMMLRLMTINEKFTLSVDAFRGSVDASNKVTSDSTTALREHTKALSAIQDNILVNLKEASDERMGAVRELLTHDSEHTAQLDRQIALSQSMPEAVSERLAPFITSLSAGIQTTIDSLNAMRTQVETLHIVAERHAEATNGIALIVTQINEAVKKIDDSTSRIDKTASALMTAIVELKEVNDHASKAPSVGAPLSLDSGLHSEDQGKPDLRTDGTRDGLDIEKHAPPGMQSSDQ